MRSNNGTEDAEAGARKRLNADTVAGGIGFAFALAYLAATFAIPEGSFANAAVGPAALPAVIGAALAVASLALAARGVLRGVPAQSPARFAVVAGLLLGYILLLLPLGYVISTFLFLFGTTMYLDRGRPVRNFVYSLLFALVVYYVFTELLTVVLPAGPLGLGPV